MKALSTSAVFIALFLATKVMALETEALGPVYPVIEPDLLALLKTHAKEEMAESSSRINRNKEILKSWSKEPQGKLLPEASEVSRHRFESNAEVREMLAEDFRRDWLFINAKHPSHIVLAKAFMKNRPAGRVILVSGSVEKTQKAIQYRVWFDQGATLVKRLKIKALPTVIEMTSDGITVTQAPVNQLLKERK